MNAKSVIVIGSGFSGLSSACFLAQKGYRVTILEKNNSIGGRARQFKTQGFTFDMGPSWYWMPEVFERFYNQFGKSTSDFYKLERLNPSYRVWWGQNDYWDIPAEMEKIEALFEKYEKGSSLKLRKFLKEAEYKYKHGMGTYVYKPGKSLLEYVDTKVFLSAFQLNMFTDMASYVRRYFKDQRIISLLEFPVLFLGETPSRTPALYSLMNYADMVLGTWYPEKGMFQIVEAIATIAKNLGVEILTDKEVVHIETNQNKVTSVKTKDGSTYTADALVASADYRHIDKEVLKPEDQQYSDKYWEERKMAPSCLLYYLGFDCKLEKLLHHNLFFDADFNVHASEIYDNPAWPSNPLFYVSVVSKTDPESAPEGCENVFILIPTAPNLIENQNVKDKYFDIVINRLENLTGHQNLKKHIVYRRDFGASNFITDYHAHKGNAYGLANTLLQTGPLKPKINHKKLKNMVFTGQLTAPGPGVPPSIISGELAANEIDMILKRK
jgi:phytoene desaturase